MNVAQLHLEPNRNKERLCYFSIIIFYLRTHFTILPKPESVVLHLVRGGSFLSWIVFLEQGSADKENKSENDDSQYSDLNQRHLCSILSSVASSSV